jgi:hypothetical protein
MALYSESASFRHTYQAYAIASGSRLVGVYAAVYWCVVHRVWRSARKAYGVLTGRREHPIGELTEYEIEVLSGGR